MILQKTNSKKESYGNQEVLHNNNNEEVLNNNELLTYERVISDNLYDISSSYEFYKYMNEKDLYTVSEDYLNLKKYKRGFIIKVVSQLKRQSTLLCQPINLGLAQADLAAAPDQTRTESA